MKSAIAPSKCAPPPKCGPSFAQVEHCSERVRKESYKDAQIGSMLHGRPIKRSLTRLFTTSMELKMARRVPYFLEYTCVRSCSESLIVISEHFYYAAIIKWEQEDLISGALCTRMFLWLRCNCFDTTASESASVWRGGLNGALSPLYLAALSFSPSFPLPLPRTLAD